MATASIVRFLAAFALLPAVVFAETRCQDAIAERTLGVLFAGNPSVIEARTDLLPIEQISVVVPIYREWTNGNLAALARTVARSQWPAARLNLVLVVNQTADVANDRLSSVREENLRTLASLPAYQMRTNGDGSLPALRPFLNGGGKLVVVDHATTGMAERNIGRVRNLGFRAALSAATVPENQHVIVLMDADSDFSASHLPTLASRFSRFPLDAVISRLRLVPAPLPDASMLRSYHFYATLTHESLLGRALNYARNGAGTPQIALRASSLSVLGGVPEVAYSEDFALMRRLSQRGVYQYARDLVVTTQDRARLDGYDAADRARWNEANAMNPFVRPAETMDPAILIASQGTSTLSNEVERGRLSLGQGLERLGRLWSYAGLPLNAAWLGYITHNWAWGLDAAERYREAGYEGVGPFNLLTPIRNIPTHGSTGAQMLANLVLRALSPTERSRLEWALDQRLRAHDHVVALRRDALQKLFERGALPPLPPELVTDPFLHSPAISGPIASALRRGPRNAVPRWMAEATAMYPDWLKRSADAPWNGVLETVLLLEEAFLEATGDPERHASMARAVAILMGDVSRL